MLDVEKTAECIAQHGNLQLANRRVLDGLATLPAMAVVGSIANVGPAVANVVSGVSEESISTTI